MKPKKIPNHCTLNDQDLLASCYDVINQMSENGKWPTSFPVNFNKDANELMLELCRRFYKSIPVATEQTVHMEKEIHFEIFDLVNRCLMSEREINAEKFYCEIAKYDICHKGKTIIRDTREKPVDHQMMEHMKKFLDYQKAAADYWKDVMLPSLNVKSLE